MSEIEPFVLSVPGEEPDIEAGHSEEPMDISALEELTYASRLGVTSVTAAAKAAPAGPAPVPLGGYHRGERAEYLAC